MSSVPVHCPFHKTQTTNFNVLIRHVNTSFNRKSSSTLLLLLLFLLILSLSLFCCHPPPPPPCLLVIPSSFPILRNTAWKVFFYFLCNPAKLPTLKSEVWTAFAVYVCLNVFFFAHSRICNLQLMHTQNFWCFSLTTMGLLQMNILSIY